MKTTDEHTTMICLFHSPEQAAEAIKDLVEAGIAQASIGVMGNSGTASANPAAMEKWKVPERDAQLLNEGINKGGVVVAVSAAPALARKVEDIFNRHQATQIDDAVAQAPVRLKSVAGAGGPSGGAIEVIEEEMTVGKRQVQRGGVRVFQRIIEKPVTQTIQLREEHVTVERKAVDRPVTAADTAFTDQSFEVTESGEEAVVSKTARVVEEVLVGKESVEHVETVRGSVRKTDVTVETIEPEKARNRTAKS